MRELLELVSELENRQEAVVYTVTEGKDFSRKVLMVDAEIPEEISVLMKRRKRAWCAAV